MPSSGVTVVIPTWRRPDHLVRCLETLGRQALAPDEILVVGRRDDTESLEAFRSWVTTSSTPARWVDVEEPGHIPPVRQGLSAARNALVAFLDDDTEAEPQWLEVLVKPFSDGRIACVGGQYVTPGREDVGKPRDAGQIRWYGRFVGHFAELPGVQLVDCEGVFEGNCCWRTEVLRSLEFDPFFEAGDAIYYGIDLCQQAKGVGYRVVYVPRARALHHRAPRPASNLQRGPGSRAYIAGRNMLYVGVKHFRGFKRATFIAWWFLVGERQSYGLTKAVWDMASGRADRSIVGASFRGRWHGLRSVYDPSP